MTTRVDKVKLVPVDEESLHDYMFDQVMKLVKPVAGHLDKYCAPYDHSVPWKREYCQDAKYWIYRVTIGAVGRIKTTADSIHLGLTPRVNYTSKHFTCSAFFSICRIARQVSRQYKYVGDIETWVGQLMSEKDSLASHRFMEIYLMNKDMQDGEESSEEDYEETECDQSEIEAGKEKEEEQEEEQEEENEWF
jgi:hypothetical protein